MKKIIVSGFALLLLIGCAKNASPRTRDASKTRESVVQIAQTTIRVKRVTDLAEQIRGLSGVPSLGANEGMLFVFEKKQPQTFWMRETLIPLDIIWISDTTVVGYAKNVPIPEPGTPNASLPLYSSGEPVNYVLEVNAGFVDAHNIAIGDPVVYR